LNAQNQKKSSDFSSPPKRYKQSNIRSKARSLLKEKSFNRLRAFSILNQTKGGMTYVLFR